MNNPSIVAIDAQQAWTQFASREATSRAHLSSLQSLKLTQLVVFVREQIGWKYPSGNMSRGQVAVFWSSPTHCLFVEVLRDGQIRWELTDDRIFLSSFEDGNEWDGAFESAVRRFATSVVDTRS